VNPSRLLPIAIALFLLGVTIAGLASGLIVLTALPIGFLLGFFLVKGDLCGASAFSEVLVLREGRKLHGVFVAAAVSAVCFAAADALGLVSLCPRPLTWASYLVGGAVFGVGMVLAGGCVSGTLYKCGAGHQNSMLALLAIPFGVMAVDFGPLSGVDGALRRHVVSAADGGPVTLTSLTGVPYPVLAPAMLLIAVVVGWRLRRPRPPGPLRDTILHRPWRPWVAGTMIGLLALPAWLSSLESGRDFPLCVTYGVEEVPLLVAGGEVDYVWLPEGVQVFTPVQGAAPNKRIYVWLILVVIGLPLGAHLGARTMGRAAFYRRPRDELVVAVIGGLLVGIGAGFGRGCMLGNAMMGTALMSVGMILFTVTAMLANWVTTKLYVIGMR
jgi:uncharacterized membrane protein YedE/YeeE